MTVDVWEQHVSYSIVNSPFYDGVPVFIEGLEVKVGMSIRQDHAAKLIDIVNKSDLPIFDKKSV
jgi:hypothetical protein